MQHINKIPAPNDHAAAAPINIINDEEEEQPNDAQPAGVMNDEENGTNTNIPGVTSYGSRQG